MMKMGWRNKIEKKRILVQFGSKLGSQKVPTMGLAGLRETHSRAFGSTQQAKEWYPYLKRPCLTTLGRTPAYCDASRISAGVLFRDCVAALFKFFNALPCSAPKSSKIHPKIGPNPPQNLPKPSQNGSKIDPEGLLEPILDQCFEEVGFWTPKKQPKSAQECPRDAPDPPRPLPNGSQNPPKSDFWAFFWCLFCYPKVASLFRRIFVDFSLFFKSAT